LAYADHEVGKLIACAQAGANLYDFFVDPGNQRFMANLWESIAKDEARAFFRLQPVQWHVPLIVKAPGEYRHSPAATAATPGGDLQRWLLRSCNSQISKTLLNGNFRRKGTIWRKTRSVGGLGI